MPKKDTSQDLPPCVWCASADVAEFTSAGTAAYERWFHCRRCQRVFCVLFTPGAGWNETKDEQVSH